MTRTSDTFGALALAALTVFALWTTTLTMPLVGAAMPTATTAASAPATPVLA